MQGLPLFHVPLNFLWIVGGRIFVLQLGYEKKQKQDGSKERIMEGKHRGIYVGSKHAQL